MYIYVELCDHDFSSDLKEAAMTVFDSWLDSLTADEFKRCVVALVYAYHVVRNKGQASFIVMKYLEDKIKVIYSKDRPTADKDGTCVAINSITGYAWTY